MLRTISDFISVFGAKRKASISREITKLHEETQRGELEELLQYFEKKTPKGEFVMVVEGKEKEKISEK